MAAPKPTKAQQGDWFTAQWLYDEIMRYIEPDLVSDQVNLLDEKYAGESEAEKENRLAHYERAFAVFDDALSQFQAQMDQEVQVVKQTVKAEALQAELEEKQAQVATLEKQLHSLDQ